MFRQLLHRPGAVSPKLQQMVDKKKLAPRPAYQLAALTPKEQGLFPETIAANRAHPRSRRRSECKTQSEW